MTDTVIDLLYLVGMIFCLHEIRSFLYPSSVTELADSTTLENLPSHEKPLLALNIVYGLWLVFILCFREETNLALIICVLSIVPKQDKTWVRIDALASLAVL